MPEIGDKFLITCEIVRPAIDGEMVPNHNGEMEPARNKRGNLWWAKIPSIVSKNFPEFLICSPVEDKDSWEREKARVEKYLSEES